MARPIVLFCARLSRRKRVLAFALLAVDLLDRGVDADFIAVGADEGDLAEFLAVRRVQGALGPHPVRGRRGS